MGKVKTKYGYTLTDHEKRAYRTIKRIVRHGNDTARFTKDGYCPFFDAFNSYFKDEKNKA